MDKYDDLLSSARHEHQVFTGSARGYISAMCQALKEENPNLNNQDISERIKKDCVEIWGRTTVYEALPDEYKNKAKQAARVGKKKKDVEESVTERNTLHTNKPLEIISGGMEDVAVDGYKIDAEVESDGKKVLESMYNITSDYERKEDPHDSLIKDNKSLRKTIQDQSADIEELKRKLLEKQQQHHNNNNNENKVELANLKTLPQEQLIDKVLELTDALEKTQLFQSAIELPTATPMSLAPGDNEVILPGKFLSTLYMILTNGEKDSIHLTIRGNEVIALEAHYQRIQKQGSM